MRKFDTHATMCDEELWFYKNIHNHVIVSCGNHNLSLSERMWESIDENEYEILSVMGV